MENKKRTKITEELFEMVKTMLKGGATQKKCAEFLGIGSATVQRIATSETYGDYNARVNAYFLRKKKEAEEKEAGEKKPEEKKERETAQVVEHRQSITIQATHYMMQELQTVNEQLKLLNNKLAFIVEKLM